MGHVSSCLKSFYVLDWLSALESHIRHPIDYIGDRYIATPFDSPILESYPHKCWVCSLLYYNFHDLEFHSQELLETFFVQENQPIRHFLWVHDFVELLYNL